MLIVFLQAAGLPVDAVTAAAMAYQGTMNARVLGALPVQINADWRVVANTNAVLYSSADARRQVLAGGATATGTSRSYFEGTAGQATGALAPHGCLRCVSQGAFATCRQARDGAGVLLWGGSCCCCHFSHKDSECSLRGMCFLPFESFSDRFHSKQLHIIFLWIIFTQSSLFKSTSYRLY